jgi:hypothetical protein
MKKTYIFIGSLLLALCFTACKETIEGDLGEPFDKVKGLSGTWELARFEQQDLNNPVKETRDLSEFYIDGQVTPLQITFDASTRSYNVAIELGKNYFGNAGSWSFDDDDYPSFLILDTGSDTLQYNLGTIVREFDNTLQIDYRRGCEDADGNLTETVVYKFIFNRTNG